jgi:hypothetical protein
MTEPPQPPEAPRDGPSSGLHLHRRDDSGLRPDDVLTGSGAPPAPVPGPSVALGAPSGVSDVDHAARVIAALRPGFRRCYNRALQTDPSMTGAFALEAKIGPTGEVAAVTVTGKKGIPAELVMCLASVFRAAQFTAPQGGAATLSMPFNIDTQ